MNSYSWWLLLIAIHNGRCLVGASGGGAAADGVARCVACFFRGNLDRLIPLRRGRLRETPDPCSPLCQSTPFPRSPEKDGVAVCKKTQSLPLGQGVARPPWLLKPGGRFLYQELASFGPASCQVLIFEGVGCGFGSPPETEFPDSGGWGGFGIPKEMELPDSGGWGFGSSPEMNGSGGKIPPNKGASQRSSPWKLLARNILVEKSAAFRRSPGANRSISASLWHAHTRLRLNEKVDRCARFLRHLDETRLNMPRERGHMITYDQAIACT